MMPELPEVETIKLNLKEKILGKKIIDFRVFDSKVANFISKDIVGSEVSGIERRGKIIIIFLSSKKILLIHLKLTGQLIFQPKLPEHYPKKEEFVRAVFCFEDGLNLYFKDLRRFGYLKLYDSDKKIEDIPELKKMGPEPFSSDFTVEYLRQQAKRMPRRKIKQMLMDQEVVAGIGNIYADEALFQAGILPMRSAKELTASEWLKLKEAILKVLSLGLKYKGASVDRYLNAFGQKGSMDQHLAVYRRTGLPCIRCGEKIKRVSLGGRGTHYCPRCQK